MVFRPLAGAGAGAGVDVGVGVGVDVGVIAGIGLDFGPGVGERVECPTSQDEAPGCFARSWSGDPARATKNAPTPCGVGAFFSGSGSDARCPQSGVASEVAQAAWRTNWTSRLIVTSLPRVKPPASSAAFQFTPNSVRSIFVVASAPNLTWP